MNIIDKIQKLVALATNNPNAEESRSAAMRACELIKEHRIALVQEAQATQSQAPQMWPPTPWAYGDEALEQQIRTQRENQIRAFWDAVKKSQERSESEARGRQASPSAK